MLKSKESRRSFLWKVAGVSSAAALMPFIDLKSGESSKRSLLILCSRGKDWGEKVLYPGWDILQKGGNVLDAVERSTNVAELDPEDLSVGYGGLPNEQGVVELDASVMYGPTHQCGSVASLQHIKTPSSVARKVMERTDHIMLVGKGALNFALAHGYEKSNLLTDRSRELWLKWRENLSDKDDWLPPLDSDKAVDKKRSTGTINVLGMDAKGDIAGITSTSGLAYKIPGRIGDSPIIGAGLYLDNSVGAAGATGRGEEVIRTCGSFLVVELMRQGHSPQQACEMACERIIKINGGVENIKRLRYNDKYVAFNVDGDVGCASILGSTPKLSYLNPEGFHVYEGNVLVD